MTEYSRTSIINWFHRTLGIDNRPNKDEIQTKCPECSSDKFYFNIRKQVGVCHKASCGFTPKIDDLIAIVGFAPDQEGYYERPEEAEKILDLKLPGYTILERQNGEMMMRYPVALDYLRSRGLTDDTILNWGLTCNGERIFLPIVSDGTLVNYNSRVLPGIPGPKYLYAPGAKTSHYILGWTEARNWRRLALVENSFVSLWLRSHLQCSTTFGSSLSDVQADLIGRSGIKTVALLWDKGAEKKAESAVKKLNARGLSAAYWRINGQPDDFALFDVVQWGTAVFEAANTGVSFIDYT